MSGAHTTLRIVKIVRPIDRVDSRFRWFAEAVQYRARVGHHPPQHLFDRLLALCFHPCALDVLDKPVDVHSRVLHRVCLSETPPTVENAAAPARNFPP